MEKFDFVEIGRACERLYGQIRKDVATCDLFESLYAGPNDPNAISEYLIDWDDKIGRTVEKAFKDMLMDAPSIENITDLPLSDHGLLLLRMRLWSARAYLSSLHGEPPAPDGSRLLRLVCECTSLSAALVWATTWLWAVSRIQATKTLAREIMIRDF